MGVATDIVTEADEADAEAKSRENNALLIVLFVEFLRVY